MTHLHCLTILAHPARPQTAPVAEHIAETLRARGIEIWLYTQWVEEDVKTHVQGSDMVVAIGGDGAMLRAARVCARYQVPVLGVNMGHLGFLTEIGSPAEWDGALDTLLGENYWVEERMMLQAALVRHDKTIASADALNDLVISRGAVTRMIRLDTYIDKGWTTTYSADALVIATATGSTAYALACGGPILPPELRNILLVPVAPHLSLDRPIILPEGATVEVIIRPDTQTDTVLWADGTMVSDLFPEDLISVQASDHVSRFVRLRERNYFYRSLLDRLEPRIPRDYDGVRKQL